MEKTHTIGRRKASVARIYVSKGKGAILVNGKDYTTYFPLETLQYKINQPFSITSTEKKYDVTVNVNGGGINNFLFGLSVLYFFSKLCIPIKIFKNGNRIKINNRILVFFIH